MVQLVGPAAVMCSDWGEEGGGGVKQMEEDGGEEGNKWHHVTSVSEELQEEGRID